MKNIYDLSYDEIENQVVSLGEKSYHAKQIWQGLYRHLYDDWALFTSLSKLLREELERSFSIGTLEEIDGLQTADHHTRKSLFTLADGQLVESVLLRKFDRLTLCISTQSGCPVGCAFCATGHLGFSRNLSGGEIVEQVIFYQRLLESENRKLTNIVFMGMGEPFLNYTNVIFAVSVLNHKDGLDIGARRITISTIGILDKIRAFADQKTQVNLSISLHASNDELRRRLVPLAAHYSVEDLIQSCRYYFDQTGRRLTFEYVMIAGVNDQPEHANQLVGLLKGLNSHINLIPLNQTDHFAAEAPDPARMKEFGKILIENGLTLTFRDSQGYQINAGCGQLVAKKN